MSRINADARILATYRITAPAAGIAERALALAIEQSVEMPLAAVRSVAIRETIAGRVESIEPVPAGGLAGGAEDPATNGGAHRAAPQAFHVTISLAAQTVGDDAGQLMNMAFGNASLQPDVELIDLALPAELLALFPGPAHGIAGIRASTGAHGRALTCTALKPQGLAPEELAELAHTLALAGVDVIKDDHGIADQAYAPFARRVPLVQRAVAAANRATGGCTVYAPSLSGGPRRLAAQCALVRAEGVGMVLACPMILGIPGFVELRQEIGVPILAHPALAGSARIDPALLLGLLFRVFGADATIFPNFGGRFSCDRAACHAIATRARAPLAGHRDTLPVPAGGMTVERVDEIVAEYGIDLMLLIGGNLLEAPEGVGQRARAFVARVGRAGVKP